MGICSYTIKHLFCLTGTRSTKYLLTMGITQGNNLFSFPLCIIQCNTAWKVAVTPPVIICLRIYPDLCWEVDDSTYRLLFNFYFVVLWRDNWIPSYTSRFFNCYRAQNRLIYKKERSENKYHIENMVTVSPDSLLWKQQLQKQRHTKVFIYYFLCTWNSYSLSSLVR